MANIQKDYQWADDVKPEGTCGLLSLQRMPRCNGCRQGVCCRALEGRREPIPSSRLGNTAALHSISPPWASWWEDPVGADEPLLLARRPTCPGPSVYQACCHWAPGLSPLPFGVCFLSRQPLPAAIPLCPHCSEGQSFFRKSQFMKNLPAYSLPPFSPTQNKRRFIKLHGLKRKKRIVTHE